MKGPRTGRFALPQNQEKIAVVVIYPALALYLFLRIFSLFNTSLLESRDSMSMIRDAKTFLSFELSRIINMPPDTTPIYPLVSALLSLPGWPVETGARLCSIFFSIVVFFSLAGIGKRLAASHAVVLALLILAINPVMVALSRSVLTEPAYIGLVYLGLWLFLLRVEKLTWQNGALLGGIFALTFLARTEGLIYLVAVPAIQLVLVILFKARSNLKAYALWAAAFVIAFCAVAAPQVWRVSHKMGHFAINGRQVWEVILNNPDGKSYDQKIYGLDYSPQQINLEYIQSHPYVVQSMVTSVSLADVMNKAAQNVIELFRKKLFALIGSLGAALTGIGLFALWRERRFADLVWIIGFLGAALAGPFVHDVDVRHIAVIAPLLALVQGIGLVYLGKRVSAIDRWRVSSRPMQIIVPAVLMLIMVLGFSAPLRAALQPPRVNRDYAIDDFKEPLAVLEHMKKPALLSELRIAARKGYFAYLSGAEEVFLPYTDYPGFVEYCRLNHVEVIFLEHDELGGFPFYENFAKHQAPEFELLHRQQSKTHGLFEFYRVLPLPAKGETLDHQ